MKFREHLTENISYKYYPGDRVELFCADGLKAVVRKPYKTDYYSGTSLVCPTIAVSSGSTVLTSLSDLTEMLFAINKSIDKLNSEGFNLIDKNFGVTTDYVGNKDNPYIEEERILKNSLKKKSESNVEVRHTGKEHNVLVKLTSGKICLYLGRYSKVKCISNYHVDPTGLYYYYLDAIDTSQIDIINGEIHISGTAYLGWTKNKRNGVLVKSYGDTKKVFVNGELVERIE